MITCGGIAFEKFTRTFKNAFPPREKEKLAFSNSSGLKRVVEKLRFRDGLVRTAGITAQK